MVPVLGNTFNLLYLQLKRSSQTSQTSQTNKQYKRSKVPKYDILSSILNSVW